MFSPYYAFARRRPPADPLNHVAINAILYNPRGKAWAMTERSAHALERTPERLRIGPSVITAEGSRINLEIDEWTVPLPGRLRGRIEIEAPSVFRETHALDTHGRHEWRPIAPHARVKVEFDKPAVTWTGYGYVDMNHGTEPLEKGFSSWNWSRQILEDRTRILYDTIERGGGRQVLALDYLEGGSIQTAPVDPELCLPKTLWRVGRATRATDQGQVRVARTLEDTPFYSRSLLVSGSGATTMHESVDLDRFAHPIVQLMLPFRMPRRA